MWSLQLATPKETISSNPTQQKQQNAEEWKDYVQGQLQNDMQWPFLTQV